MEFQLTIQGGPMAGRRESVDLRRKTEGLLALGRDPGPSGLTLEGDSTVSRHHGEFFLQGDRLGYRNRSANGTRVDGKLVSSEVALDAHTQLQIGSHEIEIQYDAPAVRSAASTSHSGSVFDSGPLANPMVRGLLAVYLVAMVALALGLRGWQPNEIQGYDEARKTYVQAYLPVLDLAPSERDRRVAEADRLAAELAAQTQGERWGLARSTCRSLMALDADPESPIYHFAAARLDTLAKRSAS